MSDWLRPNQTQNTRKLSRFSIRRELVVCPEKCSEIYYVHWDKIQPRQKWPISWTLHLEMASISFIHIYIWPNRGLPVDYKTFLSILNRKDGFKPAGTPGIDTSLSVQQNNRLFLHHRGVHTWFPNIRQGRKWHDRCWWTSICTYSTRREDVRWRGRWVDEGCPSWAVSFHDSFPELCAYWYTGTEV